MAKVDKAKRKRELRIRATALKESGYSDAEIAKALGIPEGTVRNILKENENAEG